MEFSDLCRYLQQSGRVLRSVNSGEVVLCALSPQTTVAMRELHLATGDRWLALSIPICPRERIRPRAALVANRELPIGALAVWEDQILLRQTLPIAALTSAGVEHTLRALAATAARLAAAAASVAADPDREVAFGYLFR